jgi:hypothetical protein
MTKNKGCENKVNEKDDDGKVKPEKKIKKTLQEKFEVSDKCHIIMEA